MYPLPDAFDRTDEGNGPNEVVGDDGSSLLLLSGEVQLLDGLRLVRVAVAGEQRVVEVPTLGAHPTDIEGDVIAHVIECCGLGVGMVGDQQKRLHGNAKRAKGRVAVGPSCG